MAGSEARGHMNGSQRNICVFTGSRRGGLPDYGAMAERLCGRQAAEASTDDDDVRQCHGRRWHCTLSTSGNHKVSTDEIRRRHI